MQVLFLIALTAPLPSGFTNLILNNGLRMYLVSVT